MCFGIELLSNYYFDPGSLLLEESLSWRPYGKAQLSIQQTTHSAADLKRFWGDHRKLESSPKHTIRNIYNTSDISVDEKYNDAL